MNKAQHQALKSIRATSMEARKIGMLDLADELDRIIVRERRRHAEEHDARN